MPGKLAALFRAAGTRIVHAHQCTPWFYSRVVAPASPALPSCCSKNTAASTPRSTNRKRVLVNRALIRRLTHRFVAVSEDVRMRLERYEGLDAGRIRVIYNGVTPPEPLDCHGARRAARAAGIRGLDDFVVGHGRALRPDQEPADAGAEPRRRSASSTRTCAACWWATGRSSRASTRCCASSASDRRVRLTGYRDDARQLAQCMDLFVLSSFSEGTSMALLEAMAAGVPVAVTAVGGNPEIVTAGETGWVVPSDDVAALTAAIAAKPCAMTAERERRAECGPRAASSEQFRCLAQMIDHYRELYRELLALPA